MKPICKSCLRHWKLQHHNLTGECERGGDEDGIDDVDHAVCDTLICSNDVSSAHSDSIAHLHLDRLPIDGGDSSASESSTAEGAGHHVVGQHLGQSSGVGEETVQGGGVHLGESVVGWGEDCERAVSCKCGSKVSSLDSCQESGELRGRASGVLHYQVYDGLCVKLSNQLSNRTGVV